MKRIKRLLPCLICLILMLSCNITAFASNYTDYYIKSYDVNINVLEDNRLEITENINAYFNVQKHGIYRTIPLENYVERADGTHTTVKAKIGNVSVNAPYETEKDLSEYTIKIGDADTYLTGDQYYTISYIYDLGEDRNENFDELYYNIIGDEWNTYIENVTFTITMPKEFDSENVGFSTGKYGNVGTNIINYSIDGNTITGSLTDTLESYGALTVRIELPDGYFYFDKFAYYFKISTLVIIPLFVLAIVILIWSLYGKDKKVVKVVEFYPPENMSSTDVAYWYKGKLENKDIVPLLIELANEGYLEINELPKSKFSLKSNFEINMLKAPYTGKDENKKTFYHGLFNYGKRPTVKISDLEEKFYLTLDKIRKKYDNNKKGKNVFHARSLILRYVGWALSILSAFAVAYLWIEFMDSTAKNVLALVGFAICITAFILSFFIRQRTDNAHEILQKIEGFKMFLETAEKERLETLVEENPQYFYDILPYTYVLGISDKWVSNFKDIAIEPVSWYTSTQTFNNRTFYYSLSSAMNSTTRAMTSTPQAQSTGGFSSGGGFSGGGVGGGGGGSW